MTELSEQFEQALLSADRITAQKIFFQSKQNLSPIALIDNTIVPVLEKIGRDWEQGNVSLSQVYMSALICEELSEAVTPSFDQRQRAKSKLAIAVLEDYHLLGKKIVSAVLRASGFVFLDYHRVTVNELIRQVKNDRIEILLLSILMFPSALKIKDFKNELQKQNLKTKIIVGGAPFRLDDQLWEKVGADAMGKSASEAVSLILNMAEDVS
jgi:methanogenic corrinoid protein MtbC1